MVWDDDQAKRTKSEKKEPTEKKRCKLYPFMDVHQVWKRYIHTIKPYYRSLSELFVK